MVKTIQSSLLTSGADLAGPTPDLPIPIPSRFEELQPRAVSSTRATSSGDRSAMESRSRPRRDTPPETS